MKNGQQEYNRFITSVDRLTTNMALLLLTAEDSKQCRPESYLYKYNLRE